MIHVRGMTAADLPFGIGLTQQAGWNQTEADWARALELEPEGCFVAEWNGAPVGTTTTCLFGPVAWVALVLVDPSGRRQGVGLALMRQALDFLDGRGIRTVRLDATPLGQPLYEKLGFTVQYRLARYEGILPAAAGTEVGDVFCPDDLEEWFRLDREVTATDRRKLLLRLFAEHSSLLRAVNGSGGKGFLCARPGRRALQIGPCLATSEWSGELLLRDAWRRHAGELVYVDIPDAHAAAAHLAREQGLTVQRQLTRMCRGEPVLEHVESLWASSGPEKG